MTTRTTISITDELRAEMAPFDDVMNWSAIAADAFRHAIEQERKRRHLLAVDEARRGLARSGSAGRGGAGPGGARPGGARRGRVRRG